MRMPEPAPYGPSRTMQFALAHSYDNASSPAFLRPPNPTPPVLPERSISDEPADNMASSQGRHRLDTTRPSRPRASSTPPTSPTAPAGPSAQKKNGDERTQCAGMTKKGERCTRQVRADPPLNILDPEAQIERFCFQHQKELMEPTGFYSRNGKKNWVAFADWIPGYLHPDTQAALRAEMEKPQSSSDVPGYIYTFEIRDPRDPSVIHLKVGRAVNLVKRIDEWSKQCGSKEQVLRGFWPGTVENDDSETSLMKGRVKPGEKGACCHRLERLIHLELADLAVHTPYLYKNFPNVTSPSLDQPSTKGTKAQNGSSSSLTNTPVKAARRSPGSPARFRQNKGPCADCGTIHKEIFTFVRPQKGRFKAREWDNLVKPVIEKWGRFVNQAM